MGAVVRHGCLALTAFFATLSTGSSRGSGLAVHARNWSAATVALLVAVTLTVERQRVSEEELFETTRLTAETLDGSIGAVSEGRLGAEVQERLGRPVTVESRDDLAEDTETSRTYSFDVRLEGEEQGEGPTACVTVTQYGDTDGSTSQPLSLLTRPYDCPS